MQDMETLVCRQTLAGHKHDVLCISGLQLSTFPSTQSRAKVNGTWGSGGSPAQVATGHAGPHILHSQRACLISFQKLHPAQPGLIYLGQGIEPQEPLRTAAYLHCSKASREHIHSLATALSRGPGHMRQCGQYDYGPRRPGAAPCRLVAVLSHAPATTLFLMLQESNGHAEAAAASAQLRSFGSSMENAGLVASASADGTARLWCTRVWRCVRILQLQAQPLPFLSTAISPQ